MRPIVPKALANPEKFYRKMRLRAEILGLQRQATDDGERLGQLKEYLKYASRWLQRYHRTGANGVRVVECRAIAIDVLLEILYSQACERVRQKFGGRCPEIAIFALGGYGRSELSPLSDVDIMLLYPQKVKDPDFPAMQGLFNDSLLYVLWDLGLKVGHSTRNIKEALAEADEDPQSKNAMLEARYLCGDRALAKKFTDAYRKFIRKDNVLEYLRERLANQKERRSKHGNTVFMQEPEVKNGVGGLRDFHNILWMVRLQYDGEDLGKLVELQLLRQNERADLEQAYEFLLRCRSELHFRSKRPTDLLDIEKQPKVAWSLGYRQRAVFSRVEAFMRDYYRAAYKIYHLSVYLEKKLAQNAQSRITFQSVIESRRRRPSEYQDGFEINDGTLRATSDKVFTEDPVRMIRVFRLMQSRGLEMEFDLLRLIEEHLDLIDQKLIESPEANRSFRSILQHKGDVYPALSLMNSSGVLSRFVPEWAGLHCLVQHEYYHRYTADEHILTTIRELDDVFSGRQPELTRKYRQAIEDTELPGLLYLMLFLHDIGKAKSINNHAELGAEMARPILVRLGVVEKAHEKIVFLIRHHLEMARIWQRHDLDDPTTASNFAEFLQDSELLHYLYVLTFCDARGTTPELWNDFKDVLHRQLFTSTLGCLRSPEAPVPPPSPMISKSSIIKRLPEVSEDEIEAHFSLLPDRYFNYHSEEEVLLHLRMIHQLLHTISTADSVGSLVPVVEWQDDMNLGLTVVHVVTWDRAGLFYRLAGAFALAGLSIVSSKALSRADHITIDTFYVTDASGGPVRKEKSLHAFQSHLEKILLNHIDLSHEILSFAERQRQPSYLTTTATLPASIPPKVEIYHELSLKRTVIEIEANDEVGLLYRMAQAIFKHGFDISFARISTEKKVAVDTFYIEPMHSNLDVSEKIVALREDLTAIVEATVAAVEG